MITDLLRRRFSTRQFTNQPIPEAVLAEILEAGRLSPSGGNEQPWRFGVVTDPDLIAEIADAACGQQWIAAAPLVIVLCTVPVSDERGARDIQKDRFPQHAAAIEAMDRDLYVSLNQEEHQTKIAGAHMALAALEHGVGSTWVSRFNVAALADLLRLPASILPGEMLIFGYPAQEGRAAPRKPLEQLVFHNRFE